MLFLNQFKDIALLMSVQSLQDLLFKFSMKTLSAQLPTLQSLQRMTVWKLPIECTNLADADSGIQPVKTLVELVDFDLEYMPDYKALACTICHVGIQFHNIKDPGTSIAYFEPLLLHLKGEKHCFYGLSKPQLVKEQSLLIGELASLELAA